MGRDGGDAGGRLRQVAHQTRTQLGRAARATYQSEATVKAHLAVRRALFHRGEYIFVACMPKSGSTFLTRTISELTGFEHARLTYEFERNEQELYLPKLVDSYGRSIITQQHVRATGPNLELFNRFGIRPVVLVRNLFDVIVSIRDYLHREGVQYFPSLYATDHFLELPEDEQFDFLITFAAPWYFNFYASWSDTTRDELVPTLWMSYEELSRDWVGGIEKVLAYYGHRPPRHEIEGAVTTMHGDHKRIRLNQGVAGRGSALLSARQKERLADMAAFYPWVDFGPIGL